MAEAIVAFRAVVLRSPGGRVVLSGGDWSLPRGARVRVGGARGSGATAFLRLCAGLAHPQSGQVHLDGVPHRSLGFEHPCLRRGAVAWIPQEGDLIANLTLLENVALPLRFVRGKSREEAEAGAAAALGRLSLDGEAAQRPYALSRQSRKLGALARSAAVGAELWLVDRLLDGLDDGEKRRALDLLEECLAPPGVTLVIAGDGPEVARLAPGNVRLETGRLWTEEER